MQVADDRPLQRGLVRRADQVFGQEGLVAVAPVGTGHRAKDRRDQGGDRHHEECRPLQVDPSPGL